jgi:hypothetical protein
MPRKSRRRTPSVPRFLWDLLSRPELATLLTTLQLSTAPDHAAACAVVAALLTHGLPEAITAYQTHFGAHDRSAQMTYDAQQQRLVSQPVFLHAGTALHWFLTTFWATPNAFRLKRCRHPPCQRFFFDTTKSGNKAYCSPHRRVRTRQRKRESRQRHRQNAPEARQTPC